MIENKSLTTSILEHLRGEIITYQLKGGQKLNENRLVLLREIAFMARCKTDRLSGLIRKSPLAPLFQRGG